MDDVTWSENAVREMEFSCLTSSMMNDEGQAAELANDMCPRDCLRNGTCSNGVCVCNQGNVVTNCDYFRYSSTRSCDLNGSADIILQVTREPIVLLFPVPLPSRAICLTRVYVTSWRGRVRRYASSPTVSRTTRDWAARSNKFR